ncbi:uncharacterized protein CELE_K12H6.9 [Caenorhabditis elegans]|uniref:Secreted protein n=1 Tax=Caenorhabditis elegans TaxID=6239 RepID=Q9N5H2_CAEEL|nr:Secreted protein [Caenorhabditis elegans]CCD72963.1 Secreted protein [Caenorhabditis elegans]|eukprot:NP_494375.2 Uncharacterized protein CELE_K12H6.9 [Caenorhabditis elegans]
MRVILLLLALTVFCAADALDWTALFGIQSKLILQAKKTNSLSTLYSLIPRGQDIDQYLATHDVRDVHVFTAGSSTLGSRALAELTVYRGYHQDRVYAYLWLSPSKQSATGYTMSKGFICANIMCVGEQPSV